MNQTPVKLGPLALLLTVVSICLIILSILSYTTASADMRLAEKYAETVSQRYRLEVGGQKALRDFPAGFEEDADGVCWKVVEEDGVRLRIGVEPEGTDGFRIVAWKQERDWEQNTDIDGLWPGN